MKRTKVCALFCFLIVLAAGCFAVACDEDHTHDYQAEVTAPTCTEQGYTTYTCPEDGDSYVGNYVPALGHAPAEAVRENESAATCVLAGSYDSVVYCSRCGEELSREKVTVDATGHSPAAAVRENETAATCVLAGSYDSVVYCAVCGEELSRETVTVEASGHAWDEGTVKTEATCAQAGEVVYTCTLCGETRTESVPRKEHTPGGGPTCTEPQICVFCGTVLSSAKGHTVETVAATEATCTERGNTAGTRCSVCGEVLSGLEPIPAKGHTMVDNVCTVCNAISMSAITVGSGSTVAVHDPSVVVAYADAFGNTYAEAGEGRQKVYFLFGTQLSNAYSYDMESWVTFTPTFYEEGTTTVSTNHAKIFKTAAAWSGYTDAATIKGNLWAPDIIYNPAMEKWCLYYSMSGDSSNFRSSVFLMTADNITGPYEFDGFVVFSGFAPADKGSGAGLDDYKAVTGDTDGSELGRYVNSENKWNNNYGVSCIDPAVLYDEAGDLWMFYGSWSGGIFLLKLDDETGLRDTSRTYGSGGQPIYDTDEKTALREDPYLGIHVAGGWYVSGEGPYVEYIDGYYYLFLSYGFYSPDGGYNMRVFRAENITGDYVDPDGTWAVYDGDLLNYGSDVSHGLSFMQNYKWSWWTGPASIAQGHNSVLTDDGNVYLVYHIKYDDGSVQHNVEVHRLVEGKEGGWYLVAPFQKSEHDRIVTDAEEADLAGGWSILTHTPIADYKGYAYNTDQAAVFNADGTLSGAYTGTWTIDGQYITIKTDEAGTFEGVLMEQQIEGMESEVVTYTFTAMNEDGLCIWGAKNASDEMLANIVLGRIDLPETALADLPFELTGPWGAQIAYTSSNEAVISNNGTFSAPAAETEVTITVRVTVGEATVEKQFVVTCLPSEFISEMLPDAIADDGYRAAAEPAVGGTIAPVAGISQYTGVSITFRVKDVGSDWDVMFRAPGGNAIVYLSVLNYRNENIFEAEATLSEEGKQFLTENGYGVTGFNHVIFLDEVEANQENGCVATISYNVDGSVAFYRDGELMLTYAANTAIGTAGTAKDLVACMIAQIRTQGLSVVYPVSNVIIAYAADYDKENVPENCDHDFGDYNAENEALCTICGATKIKVVTGSSSYYEMVLDPETDVVNLDPGPEWENNVASGEMTVSGDFAFRYEWDNTRDPDYWDVWIELGDAQDRWYTAPVMEPSATMLVNGWGDLYTSSTTQTVAVATLNGETLTALPAGGTADAYAGHYSALGYRVGSVFVLQVVLERVNGDVLVVTRTTEGFTKDALTVRFGGNCFFADNITSEIGTATEVEQVTWPVYYPADPAITAETGLSVSFTLANSAGDKNDWSSLINAGGYIITYGNLDPWNNTGSELAEMHCYPGLTAFGGANATALLVTEPIDVLVNITKDQIEFYKDGVLIIRYVRSDPMSDNSKTVGDFIDAFLAEVEQNGFTFAEVAFDITNVEVGPAQKIEQNNDNGRVVEAVENALETGISISATISGHSGDWATHVIATASKMYVTLPNLDPYNNISNEFPTGFNASPAVANAFVGEGATWDYFLNKEGIFLTVTVDVEQGVKFYDKGVLIIWYRPDYVMSGTTTVADFAEFVLEEIESSGFTFMEGAVANSVTTNFQMDEALTDEEVLALYQQQAGITE